MRVFFLFFFFLGGGGGAYYRNFAVCVPSAFAASSRPFDLYLSLWKWKTESHMEISIGSFDTSHLLQLSTNRFFRQNGKQP